MKAWWHWVAGRPWRRSVATAVHRRPDPRAEAADSRLAGLPARRLCGRVRLRTKPAPRRGDRLAQYNLAMMLMRGEGTAVDIDAGVDWLTKAADAGMAQAQYNLGLLAESGIGVARSLTTATAWWQKAAEQGHAEAQVQLATQYFLGRGAPKDWKLAAKWYEAAAEEW